MLRNLAYRWLLRRSCYVLKLTRFREHLPLSLARLIIPGTHLNFAENTGPVRPVFSAHTRASDRLLRRKRGLNPETHLGAAPCKTGSRQSTIERTSCFAPRSNSQWSSRSLSHSRSRAMRRRDPPQYQALLRNPLRHVFSSFLTKSRGVPILMLQR